jgi:hypothetical protein
VGISSKKFQDINQAFRKRCPAATRGVSVMHHERDDKKDKNIPSFLAQGLNTWVLRAIPGMLRLQQITVNRYWLSGDSVVGLCTEHIWFRRSHYNWPGAALWDRLHHGFSTSDHKSGCRLFLCSGLAFCSDF